jgi:hypothetical protein
MIRTLAPVTAASMILGSLGIVPVDAATSYFGQARSHGYYAYTPGYTYPPGGVYRYRPGHPMNLIDNSAVATE